MRKNEKRPIKLSLNRNTIRHLDGLDLAIVNGGRMPDGSDRDHTCDDCGPTTPMVCVL